MTQHRILPPALPLGNEIALRDRIAAAISYVHLGHCRHFYAKMADGTYTTGRCPNATAVCAIGALHRAGCMDWQVGSFLIAQRPAAFSSDGFPSIALWQDAPETTTADIEALLLKCWVAFAPDSQSTSAPDSQSTAALRTTASLPLLCRGIAKRVPSVRESLEHHGLTARVEKTQDEINRVSR